MNCQEKGISLGAECKSTPEEEQGTHRRLALEQVLPSQVVHSRLEAQQAGATPQLQLGQGLYDLVLHPTT